jgi:chromate reductase
MNIIAISGSLRKDSFNTALLRVLQQLAPTGMKIEIAEINMLPIYNQDDEAFFPKEVQTLKDKISTADGIIIATPEYNRSISGALKNAIDWVSRPYGQNSFSKKSVLVMGVSVGKLGSAFAQSHLKQILSHLDADVIGQPELFLGPASEILGKKGDTPNASTKELLIKALGILSEHTRLNN